MKMSETINELSTALSKAQADFKPIKKGATNPFFKSKYATLDACIEATRDSLVKHGLAVVQMPENEVLNTLLTHTSGQWISSETPLCIGKNDAQAFGSAVTYARRYSYSAMLNCASETDEDGNLAKKNAPKPKSLNTQYQELSAKADSREKWNKLLDWVKGKRDVALIERCNMEFELWCDAVLASDEKNT